MKVLLTGSKGQLGNALINSKPNNIDLIATDRVQLDLENYNNCYEYICKNKPDWVINSGAYTNVDKAELEKELVFKINFKAPEAIAKALNSYGGKLFQISTDYVFDGSKTSPYNIEDRKAPQNVYGQSKDLAEESIKKILQEKNQFIVLRTSWLIGPVGKNFLFTIIRLLNEKEEIKVVNDQIGSMTSTLSLSHIIWKLIELNNEESLLNKSIPNFFHWSDYGILSWYDLASAIKAICDEKSLIKKSAKIIPISTEEYKFIAKRPLFSILNCDKTEEVLGIKRNDWNESLLKIINNLLLIKSNLKKTL